MIRALGILAVVAALAVSAAPVASAASSKKPPPRGTTGIVTNNNDPEKLGKARVIEAVNVKYTAVNAMFFPWDMAAKAPPGSLKPPNGIIAILIG